MPHRAGAPFTCGGYGRTVGGDMLTAAQVDKALKFNNTDTEAMALLPRMLALFGLPDLPEWDERAVQQAGDLQRSMALAADGQVGPKTQAKLSKQQYIGDVDTSVLWPKDGDAQEHFEQLVGAFGYRVRGGAPFVLGLRGCFPWARLNHRMVHAPRYDDAFVLLVNGKAPYVFAGATHAYQNYSTESADQNRDRVGDVGSIRPGVFSLKLVVDAPPEFSIALRTMGSAPHDAFELPAFRDTDHDGVISEAEAEASTNATTGEQVKPGVGAFANSVLFHPGYTVRKPSGKAFSSIACQTAPIEAMNMLKAAGRDLTYLLVDAPMAARMFADTLPPPATPSDAEPEADLA